MDKILIITCTNRPNSYSQKVAKIYANILKNRGVDYEEFSLEQLPKTIIADELYDKRTPAFELIIDKYIRQTKRFIFVVPEYNGGYPGVLKVFFDAIHPREWTNKKACLVGVSSGRAGNLRGMDHLTGVLHYLKMNVYYNKLPISLIDKILTVDNQFTVADQQRVCEMQISGFIEY